MSVGCMNKRQLIKKFSGFSIVGGFVTVLGLVLSYFFLKIMRTPLYLTYVTLYLATILLSYFLNTKYVFKVKKDFRQSIKYFVVYAMGMIIGVIVLNIFKETLPFENWVLAYLVLPVTMLCNFILASKVLTNENNHEDSALS